MDLKNKVSFEEIRNSINQYLAEKDTLDLSNLSAVSLMVDTIAAGIEVSKYEVLCALQETFLDSAILSDSIYQLTDTLFIRLVTKSPCFSEITVSSQTSQFIPPYTQFVSDDIYVYNRKRFSSSSNPVNVEIYEGKIYTESFIVSDSKPYIILKYKDFKVSTQDIRVMIDGEEWGQFDGDKFELSPTDKTFLVSVNHEGAVKVYFGTGKFGAVPTVGSKVEVTYAVTKGEDGSQVIQGKLFTSTNFPTLNAYGVGSLLGGDNEKDPSFYKEYGPWLSASKEWASRDKDFRALTVKFPGVIDCSIQNQAQLAPNDRRWENFVQLTLLTNDVWSNSSFSKLQTYLTGRSSDRLHFLEKSAVAIPIDISYIVYCYSNANLDSIKNLVTQELKDFLSPKSGCLGKSVRMADLEEVILNADSISIKNYTRLYPNIDYTGLQYYEYITYGDINITTMYAED